MNKPNDIIFYYGNPNNSNEKGEQARLVEKLKDHGKFEEWTVEFIDQPDHYYNVLIKKT